jgi:hypothetical protein
MKVKISGDTPMERLTNFTRGILAVPKADVQRAEKKRKQQKLQRKRT